MHQDPESTMTYSSSLKSAAVVLAAALAVPALLAQTTTPSPQVMTDVAPLPASERGSLGAILLEDSPVLAQREAFQQLAARREAILLASDPMRDSLRTMGAGPAPATDSKKKPRKPATPEQEAN
jgi:hypothetical protein